MRGSVKLTRNTTQEQNMVRFLARPCSMHFFCRLEDLVGTSLSLLPFDPKTLVLAVLLPCLDSFNSKHTFLTSEPAAHPLGSETLHDSSQLSRNFGVCN